MHGEGGQDQTEKVGGHPTASPGRIADVFRQRDGPIRRAAITSDYEVTFIRNWADATAVFSSFSVETIISKPVAETEKGNANTQYHRYES